jgi:hypothetical protein
MVKKMLPGDHPKKAPHRSAVAIGAMVAMPLFLVTSVACSAPFDWGLDSFSTGQKPPLLAPNPAHTNGVLVNMALSNEARPGHIAEFEELEAARKAGTPAAYDLFLARHPKSRYAEEARKKRAALLAKGTKP